MKKYRVWAIAYGQMEKHKVMNAIWQLLGSVDATSFENANEVAKQMFVGKSPFRIDDGLQDNGNGIAYEFKE